MALDTLKPITPGHSGVITGPAPVRKWAIALNYKTLMISRIQRCRQDDTLLLDFRQIDTCHIQGFNGSQQRLRSGNIVLAYRAVETGPGSIAFAKLDGKSLAVLDTQVMDWHNNEDPRLIPAGTDRFYVQTQYYQDGLYTRIELRLMEVQDTPFSVREQRCLGKFDQIGDFPGYVPSWEKNWQPFLDEQVLQFVYSIVPHRILRHQPAANDGTVSLAHEVEWDLPAWWNQDWGTVLCGSGVPLRISRELWLAFWHTRANWNGEYYTGLYSFSADPPYSPVAISPPVLRPDDAIGYNPRSERGQKCIFICGSHIDGEQLVLTGGNNDSAVLQVRMNLNQALTLLRPLELHATKQIRISPDIFTISGKATVGELASSPDKYFDFGNVKTCPEDFSGNVNGKSLIVSDCGLWNPDSTSRLKQLIQSNHKRTVLWGIPSRDGCWPEWFRHIDLVGTRDLLSDYPPNTKHVPCASCMSALFDVMRLKPRTQPFIAYFDYTLPVVSSFLAGLPFLRTNWPVLKDILGFLASAETVITNDFHGAYWSALLERQVVFCLPTEQVAAPHLSFKHALAYDSVESTFDFTPPTQDKGYLEHCRELNRDFYRQVIDLLE